MDTYLLTAPLTIGRQCIDQEEGDLIKHLIQI